ncbi:glycoside hydrolase family 26 protein [Cystobasidium minutum MCA 4210]|uniref:glycoside hydrolase family 26 protein n=1 Tax=Cystobasidium minutum MCA 4210 TaxID=1397322 RepID=UPI0034CDED57|eukprot:jgi/Rhomi1/211784/estExt_Genemark1.C_5_t10337
MLTSLLFTCLLGMHLRCCLASPITQRAAALQARCEHPDSEACSTENGRPTPGGFSHPKAIRRNGIYLGLFPNPDETLCELEKVVDAPFAFYGITVQLSASQIWDGKETWNRIDDLKKAEATLQLSIIPDPTWYGLTKGDGRQAVAIAKQVKRVRDAMGTAVWLRFAPEMNCMPDTYVTYDEPRKSLSPPSVSPRIGPTIPPSVSPRIGLTIRKRDMVSTSTETTDSALPTQGLPDARAHEPRRYVQPPLASSFLVAWQLVYNAVKAEAPDTQMIWSPAIAEDEDEYEQYYPAGYAPDMVGLTYEPTKKDTVSKFLKKVRPFHDEFASDESPFLLTRTAPSINKVSEKGRIDFLNLITHKDVAKKLPYYLAATYHNFNDNVDKRIITLKREPQLKVGKKDSMNKKFKAWVKATQ